MKIKDLGELVKEILVEHPIKGLMGPEYNFVENLNGSISLSIKMNSLTLTGTPMPHLEALFPITEYQADRFVRRPQDLTSFVFHCTVEYFKHELSESMTFRKNYVVMPVHRMGV